MVQAASSSKSKHSQGKSTRTAVKSGKKPADVSIAKAKKTKQQNNKKGKLFFLLNTYAYASNVELDQMKMQNLSRKI
jgi:hypothetical protein